MLFIHSATTWLIGLIFLGNRMHIISNHCAKFHVSSSFHLTARKKYTKTENMTYNSMKMDHIVFRINKIQCAKKQLKLDFCIA